MSRFFEGVLEQMEKNKPLRKICTDEEFTYREVIVNGEALMYRQKTLRPDGRRMYLMNDVTARTLGYGNISDFISMFPDMQYWRRFLTPQTIRKGMLSER